ncbi:MAG: hypothetical protein AAGB02_02785 [Pseudomonadota bacterium]
MVGLFSENVDEPKRQTTLLPPEVAASNKKKTKNDSPSTKSSGAATVASTSLTKLSASREPVEITDVATPQFSRGPNWSESESNAKRVVRERVREVVEGDDKKDRKEPFFRMSKSSVALAVAFSAVFLAFVAIAIASGRSEKPLCSELPDWNQSDCRI